MATSTDTAPTRQRQQVQVTLMLDVALPPGGMRHVLVPAHTSGDPADPDAVPEYTRLDYFTAAVVDQVNGLLRDSTWDGAVWAVASTTVADPYTPASTDQF